MSIHSPTFTLGRPSHLGGGSWNLSNLTDITVLFGKNGSGKSMILRGLRDQAKNNRHYTSPERAGEISFNPGYMQDELSFEGRANNNTRNFSPTYRERVVARIQTYLAKRGSLPKDQILGDPAEIAAMINILIPEFDFKIVGGNPPFEITRNLTQEKITNVNQLSSGECEMISLALDILLICEIWTIEGQKGGILLIDEPDTHLHPDLQQHLAHFLTEVVEKYSMQIIVATHSTTLLSSLGFYGQDKTSVIYLNNRIEDQVATKFNSIMQEISTCLGGHVLMGPLFGSPLVLVEGDDDYRIWSQVPRHSKVQLAVIPCNGDEISRYQQILEKIFQSILPESKTSSAFLIKDGDKSCNNNGYMHVKSIKLSCLESENLYLTDEVLISFGLTWDNAKEKVKQESSNYGNKAEELNSIDGWDRKTKDLKNVIFELSRILDLKNVPWTLRVGKCIGEKKPEGQLADFLGMDVVNSFWT